jgi:hypothetical protein
MHHAHRHAGIAASEGEDRAQLTARSKAHFSLQHLLAAAAFSREVAELEQRHAGEAFGPFFDDILARCTAAVLSADACVEAYANELLLDPIGTFSASDELIHGVYFRAGLERRTPHEKLDVVLRLRLHRDDLTSAKLAGFDDVGKLASLRNALVHFKPEWMDSTSGPHDKLSRQLAQRFRGSPFLEKSERLFPRRWASHSCTSWAVSAVLTYLQAFEAAAGLPRRFEQFSDRLAAG